MERLEPVGFSRCGQGWQAAARASLLPPLDKAATQEAVANGGRGNYEIRERRKKWTPSYRFKNEG